MSNFNTIGSGLQLPPRGRLYSELLEVQRDLEVKYRDDFTAQNLGEVIDPGPVDIYFKPQRLPLYLPGFGSDEVELTSLAHITDPEDCIGSEYLNIFGNFYSDGSPYIREGDQYPRSRYDKGNDYQIAIPRTLESPPVIFHTDTADITRETLPEVFAEVNKHFITDEEAINILGLFATQVSGIFDFTFFDQDPETGLWVQ